ncbi:MAG: hypothetical protein WD669_04100, partial [Pirellulales bacterium]
RGPDTTGGERVLILSAGVGAGHNSAAAAVQQECAARADIAEVQVLDVLQVSSVLYRALLGKGYFVLAEGLPITELPELKPWPTNLTTYYAGTRRDATIGGGASGSGTVATTLAPVIPAPPGP